MPERLETSVIKYIQTLAYVCVCVCIVCIHLLPSVERRASRDHKPKRLPAFKWTVNRCASSALKICHLTMRAAEWFGNQNVCSFVIYQRGSSRWSPSTIYTHSYIWERPAHAAAAHVHVCTNIWMRCVMTTLTHREVNTDRAHATRMACREIGFISVRKIRSRSVPFKPCTSASAGCCCIAIL